MQQKVTLHTLRRCFQTKTDNAYFKTYGFKTTEYMQHFFIRSFKLFIIAYSWNYIQFVDDLLRLLISW